MSPTFSGLFSFSGLLLWSLLFGAVHAAEDSKTRIANRTIERVGVSSHVEEFSVWAGTIFIAGTAMLVVLIEFLG